MIRPTTERGVRKTAHQWGCWGSQAQAVLVGVCGKTADQWGVLRIADLGGVGGGVAIGGCGYWGGGMLKDDTQELQTLRVKNDVMMEVVYRHIQDEDPVQVNVNIFVACFTTCWARLKLYREGFSQLHPEQVLYFDPYSIIFSQRPGDPTLPTGNYLCKFSSELKSGDHIVEFPAAGPKNYGYRTEDGKVECKVRGFTLNACG